MGEAELRVNHSHQTALDEGSPSQEQEGKKSDRGFNSGNIEALPSPEQWQRLRQDPALARAAFDEVLRYESPVQTFFRTTTRPVEVAGVQLGEGEKVLLFLAAANRDARRWDNPDR